MRHIGKAVTHLARHRFLQVAVDLDWQSLDQLARVRHLFRHHAQIQVRGGLTFEGFLPGDHLKHDHTQGVDIRLRGGGAAPLFRRHVGSRADPQPGVSEGVITAFQRFGDAEVSQRKMTMVVQEDIGGFDIAVDDTARVHGLESLCQWQKQTGGLLVRHGAAQAFFECAAGQVIHHQEWIAFMRAIIEQDDHAGDVTQACLVAGLAPEAFHDAFQLAGRDLLTADELDRHLAVERHIFRQIDNRHTARAQLAQESVTLVDQWLVVHTLIHCTAYGWAASMTQRKPNI